MSWEQLWEILTITTFSELLLIFIAKVIEVTIGTVRNILIVKGYRAPAVLLALVEITIWVFVASQVINGISESPMKGIAYALGYTAGIYFGSVVEKKLAFGKTMVQVITTPDNGIVLADILRKQGYGVTSVEAKGKDEKRCILMILANRRGNEMIDKIALEIDDTALIVRNDVTAMIGGYLLSSKSIFK